MNSIKRVMFKGNAFVSIQIEDNQVVNSLTNIQGNIIELSPKARNSVVPPISFHITLIAFHYKYRTDIKKRIAEAVAKAMESIKGTTLAIKGISSNGYNVVAKVEGGRTQLIPLVESLKRELEKTEGVTVDPKFDRFDPHVTLFTENFKRFPIPEAVLSIYRNNTKSLGLQSVSSVQVLSMQRSVKLNGNYEKLTEDIALCDDNQSFSPVEMTSRLSEIVDENEAVVDETNITFLCSSEFNSKISLSSQPSCCVIS